ncbi:MAG: LptF/LptG family permease [Gemmatimonadetes bacterium]|nr:LptF/LptG family permease [Gemmatimonadota bacterium]
MTILSKYLLRSHLVPLVFALTAVTGIMMLNQIAKRLPSLVGKGLPWTAIVEVFALSLPFVIAMTLPMAVLVSVLYTVSRMAADNELTALRAGGVSLGRLLRPLLLAGATITALAFLFSDQVLPRSNHRLKTLLTDIARTKPTFSLEEQIINEIQRDRFFLRANSIDQATYVLRDVTIYDLTNQTQRRTIYADSGTMGFGPEQDDLFLTLYDGSMHEADRTDPRQFQLMNFRQKIIRIEGMGRSFTRSGTDRFKGDREMGVCEMDSVITVARREMQSSRQRAAGVELNSLRGMVGLAPMPIDSAVPLREPGFYCRAVEHIANWLAPEAAEAQEQESDTVHAATQPTNEPGRVEFVPATTTPNVASAKTLRDRARSAEIRTANYLVEVHKKYAMAAASIVFVLVGVPVAIAFPRAGVGLVIGVSLTVFSIYYVGLIGGESLANQLKVPPMWAMWAPDIVFGVLGLFGLWRIRNGATIARSGGPVDMFRRLRART